MNGTSVSANFIQRNCAQREHLDEQLINCLPNINSYNNQKQYYNEMDYNYNSNSNYNKIKTTVKNRQLNNMETSITTNVSSSFYKFLARFSGKLTIFNFSLFLILHHF